MAPDRPRTGSPPLPSRRARHLGATALAGILLASVAAHGAQEIPFKVIDGRLCAACTLAGQNKSIAANVVIDLGSRVPLMVHTRTARMLQIGGQATGEVRFGEFVLDKLRVATANLGALEELSNRYASELGETPAVAIIGMPAFTQYTLELDIASGVLRLLSPEDPTPAGAGAVALTYEEGPRGYYLAGNLGADRAVRVAFSTAGHDTLIDSALAEEAGSPGGAFDTLSLDTLNIARYVALRPEPIAGPAEPPLGVTLGNGLLAHFRVRIEPPAKRMIFEETRPAAFPTEERDFFVARAANDAPAIEAFIKAHARSRLAREAGENLLRIRLGEEPPNRDATLLALRLYAEGVIENRRSQALVELTDRLLGSERGDRYELAKEALLIATGAAQADINSTAAYHIQAREGLIALRENDLTLARRKLISASFGLPRDRFVNLWLGELYERTGKLTRAWSRYIQSALDREPPRAAFAAIDRLNRNPEFRKVFTMQDAEQLLEGRIVEFHPPGRFTDSDDAAKSTPVQLVELFTCIAAPSTGGPELAFAALREHFEGTPVAFVQYHLSAPDLDPLTSDAAVARAAQYKVTTAPAAYFDGQDADTSEGDDKAAGRVMNSYRKASLPAGQRDRPWTLTGHAATDGGVIRGTVTLARRGASAAVQVASRPVSAAASAPATQPASEDWRLHLVLCERTVMVPGANKLVLHRCVARALLSPPEGHVIASDARRQSVQFDTPITDVAAAVEKRLAAIEQEEGVRFAARPSYVDAAGCTVVAILQDARSGRVAAACSIDVKPEVATSP